MRIDTALSVPMRTNFAIALLEEFGLLSSSSSSWIAVLSPSLARLTCAAPGMEPPAISGFDRRRRAGASVSPEMAEYLKMASAVLALSNSSTGAAV